MLGAPANSALPKAMGDSPCQRSRKASRRRDWKKLTMPDLIQQGGRSVFKRGVVAMGRAVGAMLVLLRTFASGKANKAASCSTEQ